MSLFRDAAVRLVRASLVVDRAQRLFDRARSAFVARFASDAFLESYNAAAFEADAAYAVGSTRFREGLFHWEEEMTRRTLPVPPARLLVGGAGGGREVYAFAARGYAVVAFEPSPTLARSIVGAAGAYPGTEVWLGRYEELPQLRDVESGAVVDVRTRGPFDAVILGWPTYSHLRTRERRVATLEQFGQLTPGPIALSLFVNRQRDTARPGRLASWARRVGLSRPGDAFSPHIGFHHWSTEQEVRGEIAEAGLEVVDASWDDRDGRWPWIVARRPGSVSA